MARTPLEELLQRQAQQSKQGTVLTKDLSGQLTSYSPESLQQRAELSGLPSPGTTPLSGQMIGGTADQTKMQGTPNQVLNAARQTLQPGQQQLEQVKRTRQAATEGTPEQQQRMEQINQLKAIGNHAAAAATQLIGNEVDKLTAQNVGMAGAVTGQGTVAAPQWSAQSQAIMNAPPGELNDAQKATLGQDINNWMEQVKKDTGNYPTSDDISALFPASGAQHAVAAFADANVRSKLPLDTQFISKLELPGVQNLDQLQQQYGLSLKPGATLQDFQEAVQKKVDETTQEVDKLQKSLEDPNSSATSRAEARQQLIDMGAIGLTAGAQQAHEVEKGMSELDKVSFGGKEHDIDELFADSNFSAMVSDYYNMTPEDREKWKKQDANSAKLGNWLDKQENNLGSLTKELDTDLIKSTKQVEDNKNTVSEMGVQNPELAKALFGDGWDTAGKGAVQVPPGLAQLAQQGVTEARDAMTQMNALYSSANVPKDVLQKLMSSTTSQNIAQMAGDNPTWVNFTGALKKPQSEWSATEKYAFSGINSLDDLKGAQKRYDYAQQSTALGVDPNKGPLPGPLPQLAAKYSNLLSDGQLSKEDVGQIGSMQDLKDLLNWMPKKTRDIDDALANALNNERTRYTQDTTLKSSTIGNTPETMRAAVKMNKHEDWENAQEQIKALQRADSAGNLTREGRDMLKILQDWKEPKPPAETKKAQPAKKSLVKKTEEAVKNALNAEFRPHTAIPQLNKEVKKYVPEDALVKKLSLPNQTKAIVKHLKDLI